MQFLCTSIHVQIFHKAQIVKHIEKAQLSMDRFTVFTLAPALPL
jgi:hypothetical protein